MTDQAPSITGPAIWLVLGLPGTGKSTLAARLAALSGARHLNTDIIRSQLGLRGHYDAADKDRVYAALLSEARLTLTRDGVVILDGTFATEARRRPVRELAHALNIPLRWIVLQASEELVLERVARPRPDSEAGPAVYHLVKDHWEPLSGEHLLLNSGETDGLTLARQALAWLNQPDENHEQ